MNWVWIICITLAGIFLLWGIWAICTNRNGFLPEFIAGIFEILGDIIAVLV